MIEGFFCTRCVCVCIGGRGGVIFLLLLSPLGAISAF